MTYKAINVVKYFLIALGKTKNSGQTTNINGLTFATGNVFWKFQSFIPFLLYEVKAIKKRYKNNSL